MESSSFIVSLVSAQHVLSVSQPLSKALQNTECDIVKAYRDAALCRNTILKQHEDIKFSTIWEKATIIGDSIGIELTKPRTASNSKFRSNSHMDFPLRFCLVVHQV